MTTELDSPTGVLPFGWESTHGTPEPAAEQSLFRFPAVHDPAPGNRRLLLMSLLASALGMVAVGVGLVAAVSTIAGRPPGWYAPVLVLAGLLSVALAVGGFLSIHRRALPYVLLLAASVPLAADVLIAIAY
ncbi:hypothetical protein [Mangrovihabitans endophyticus]|uniref:Uncharacterized protein n=1 Tax=Mangrovihabitans endophyticus TaxID=1751298 RepID=A0A8J3FNH4_9ACTN|nr:hypothetical protein [Mangrovihabitans endophyticus]GGK87254.1 hypothetical protein GCM10012284_21650 [Mangrovihabitans endophyticus]